MGTVSTIPTGRKLSFLLRISLVNVKKLVENSTLHDNFGNVIIPKNLFCQNTILALLFPMFPFDQTKNIRKAKFLGGSKEKIGKNKKNENNFTFP